MRKIWIVISVIVILLMFQGCGSETTYWENWAAPNWTSTGKIVFLEDTGEQKINSWGNMVGGNQTITLYEIDEDGSNLQQVREIISCDFESGRVLVPVSTSSIGDWVVLSMEDWRRGDHYPVMYAVKRNGDSLSEIGSGRNSDFSPDASQIVYEKPNQGIWIMDRDGDNDQQIISDTDARYPAWSPDTSRIAFTISQAETLKICNTSGSIISFHTPTSGGWYEKPDWGPSDTNAVIADVNGRDRAEVIYLNPESILTIDFLRYPKWFPNGARFIGYDGSWFVINRTGTNRWYLQP